MNILFNSAIIIDHDLLNSQMFTINTDIKIKIIEQILSPTFTITVNEIINKIIDDS